METLVAVIVVTAALLHIARVTRWTRLGALRAQDWSLLIAIGLVIEYALAAQGAMRWWAVTMLVVTAVLFSRREKRRQRLSAAIVIHRAGAFNAQALSDTGLTELDVYHEAERQGFASLDGISRVVLIGGVMAFELASSAANTFVRKAL